MQTLIVGENFPGKVPFAPQGGGIFEITKDLGLMLFVQMPNPSPAEMASLAESFARYSLYVSPEPPHAAVWVWKYPAPLGYMETPFHAGLYQDERIQEYLAKPVEDNNLLTVICLDGQKIIRLRAVGMKYEALEAFKDVVRQQQNYPLAIEGYQLALDKIYRMTSREIYERGKSWTVRVD